ncbi:uncharacterized protein LOC111811867 [Cucurbita pepo subsp. pepo]|uniref:uncharacterized protein LOC111811867 n=1 Tax=Cucurbita pepo subsp. pepo TaxID=3664 RepID=UPI000C9D924B|nr:uncharacterized protein LOC111811867 [Cucurbita pepo subsp. pepo]
MESALIRTVSVPVLSSAVAASSSFSNYKPLYGALSGQNSSISSPKISLHFEINHRRGKNWSGIRRAASESDISRSLHEVSSPYDQFGGFRSRYWSVPSEIPEDEFLNQDEFHRGSFADTEFLNSGIVSGDGGDFVADKFTDGSSESSKIRAYYEEMLKSNPSDALILRNYGKFLHEVEKDSKRAEECYSRAILASPRDGELLALYGKLVWDTQRDKRRAQYYFDRAVCASPNDCLVIGYYAHFLWLVEDDEEEAMAVAPAPAPALVAAF